MTQRYVKTAYAGCPYITAGKVYEAADWIRRGDHDCFTIKSDYRGRVWVTLIGLYGEGFDWIECTADGTPIDGDGVARDARSVSSPETAGRFGSVWGFCRAIQESLGLPPTLTLMSVTTPGKPAVYLNSHRIAGQKPWGGGDIVESIEVKTATALQAVLGTYAVSERVSRALADRSESDSGASTITTLREALGEAADALEAALEWIDAVPGETVLPAMPGFDRDTVNVTATKARELLK